MVAVFISPASSARAERPALARSAFTSWTTLFWKAVYPELPVCWEEVGLEVAGWEEVGLEAAGWEETGFAEDDCPDGVQAVPEHFPPHTKFRMLLIRLFFVVQAEPLTITVLPDFPLEADVFPAQAVVPQLPLEAHPATVVLDALEAHAVLFPQEFCLQAGDVLPFAAAADTALFSTDSTVPATVAEFSQEADAASEAVQEVEGVVPQDAKLPETVKALTFPPTSNAVISASIFWFIR